MLTRPIVGAVFPIVTGLEVTGLVDTVPSLADTAHATESPLLKNLPVNVAVVAEIAVPLTVHE